MVRLEGRPGGGEIGPSTPESIVTPEFALQPVVDGLCKLLDTCATDIIKDPEKILPEDSIDIETRLGRKLYSLSTYLTSGHREFAVLKQGDLKFAPNSEVHLALIKTGHTPIIAIEVDRSEQYVIFAPDVFTGGTHRALARFAPPGINEQEPLLMQIESPSSAKCIQAKEPPKSLKPLFEHLSTLDESLIKESMENQLYKIRTRE